MSQDPTSDAIGTIDHVVIAVPQLASSAECYRRLGFTLSVRGVHSAALGTENHTIMLRDDYFELLSVLTPTERNKHWRQEIAAGGGVAGVAMTTSLPARAYDIWKAAGLSPETPIKFSRPVLRPDGATLEARFEVVSLADVPGTALRVFVCSQPTREAVWLPELLDHANGAVAIRRIEIACPEPSESARAWGRVLPGAVATADASGFTLDTGRHSIRLVRAEIAQPRATGIDFAVSDIAACRKLLARNGIDFAQAGSRISVDPSSAANVRIGFETAS